ncbi:unnamed protein product [Effrenium voratum]|nr:unnamed protein product [Effrenium voratum]
MEPALEDLCRHLGSTARAWLMDSGIRTESDVRWFWKCQSDCLCERWSLCLAFRVRMCCTCRHSLTYAVLVLICTRLPQSNSVRCVHPLLLQLPDVGHKTVRELFQSAATFHSLGR